MIIQFPQKVADSLGISLVELQQIVAASNPSSRRWSNEEIQQLTELRAAGHSFPSIAEQLGRTTKSVTNKFYQSTDAPREGLPLDWEDERAYKRWWKEKTGNIPELAKTLGRSLKSTKTCMVQLEKDRSAGEEQRLRESYAV